VPKIERTEYRQSDPAAGQPGSVTTLELAKACPKCKTPGMQMSQTPVSTGPNSDIRPGTTAIIFKCMNGTCTWYETTWVVQVNPDGTVPIPHRKDKQFPISETFFERGKALVEATERQVAAETSEGAEVRIRGHFA